MVNGSYFYPPKCSSFKTKNCFVHCKACVYSIRPILLGQFKFCSKALYGSCTVEFNKKNSDSKNRFKLIEVLQRATRQITMKLKYCPLLIAICFVNKMDIKLSLSNSCWKTKRPKDSI